MKVFCINDNGWYFDKKIIFWNRIIECDGPSYGDINTVTSEYYKEGKLYYDLLEWPPKSNDDGFEADCFIPLSEIDETEMVNSKEIGISN